uniref:Retinol binding protein 1a, cellular n=1 Tax=Astyanax mexicanus TaxID=7994 RepID=A0A3B1JFM9_ASTMX
MSKPNYSGLYHLVSQENFESYLAALDVNFALRKVVCLLKPSKQIEHDINTEFTEDLGPVDGRMCQTTVDWDGDKLQCVQRGEKEGRGWTHWLEGNMLHLTWTIATYSGTTGKWHNSY